MEKKNAARFNTQNNLSVECEVNVHGQYPSIQEDFFFSLSGLTSLAISLLTNNTFFNFFYGEESFPSVVTRTVAALREKQNL